MAATPPASSPPPTPPSQSAWQRFRSIPYGIQAAIWGLLGLAIGVSGSPGEQTVTTAGRTQTSIVTIYQCADGTEGREPCPPVEETTSEAPSRTTATTALPQTTTTARAVEAEVASFSGTGTQSTRPFRVSSGWEIRWEAQGDLFQIFLRNESGEPVGVPANQQGAGSGSSYQARGGSYYLEMNALGPWTVTVVDLP